MATIHRSRLNDIPHPDYSLPVVTVRLETDRVLMSEEQIKNSDDAVRLVRDEMQELDREHFIVINVDTRMHPINMHVASIGNLNSAPVSPREIFKASLLSNAAGVILLHNHPSGDPTPSLEDMEVTERLISSGKLLGVKVLDHIVVGRDHHTSIKALSPYEWDGMENRIMYGIDSDNVLEGGERYNATSTPKKSFREKVADIFIQSIKEDPKDWVKKWASNETEAAYNMVSGARYRGGNAFILKYLENVHGYSDPRWMTFIQAKEAGYKVPKGTKATPVEYYYMWDRKTGKSIEWSAYNKLSSDEKNELVKIGTSGRVVGEDERGSHVARYQLRMREHYVFNAAQLEGVPEYEIPNRVVNDIAPSAIVDAVARGMGVEIEEVEQGRAFYSPREDKITLPLKSQFDSDYDYQTTALHELGHATGHETRLNRDQQNWFGTPEYAYEELVAEITSSFMGEYLDVPMNDADMDNHVAYIQGWIEAIEKDPNYLFKAIKEAEKAADYMAEKGELKELVASMQPLSYEDDLGVEREANTAVAEKEEEYTASSNFTLDDVVDEYRNGTYQLVPLRNFIVSNYENITVLNNVSGEYGETFNPPMYLTPEAENYFADILDSDVRIYSNFAVIDINNGDAIHKMELAEELFNSFEGYDNYGKYDDWFRDTPKPDRVRLYEEIEATLSFEKPSRESVLLMSHTPQVLLDLGLEDKPILMAQQHLRNILHSKGDRPSWHGLQKENILGIEYQISNPSLVYDSLSRDDSVVVVTNEMDSDGFPIVAALRTNGEGWYEFEKVNSNYLTSVYGHEHLENQIRRALDSEKLLYCDNIRTQRLGNLAQIQFLYGLPQLIGYDGIIHKSENIVNEGVDADYLTHFDVLESDVDPAELEDNIVFSLDELYKRAEEAKHLSPELKALDAARYDLAIFIRDNEGESPYDMADAGKIDSAEEYIEDYLAKNNLMPIFDARGNLTAVSEVPLTVHNLNRDQLSELKVRLLQDRLEEKGEGISYGEIARIDELVSNEDSISRSLLYKELDKVTAVTPTQIDMLSDFTDIIKNAPSVTTEESGKWLTHE